MSLLSELTASVDPQSRRCFLKTAAIGLSAASFGHCSSHARAQNTAKRLAALQVSHDGRRIERTDGEPFFWLADTAWYLMHRLTQENADFYLNRRAEQGFTVVQVMFLPTHGRTTPNRYGATAFTDSATNPVEPNPAWFEHVDWVIDRAEQLGLYVVAMPSWRYHWRKMATHSGESSQPFLDSKNARAYGRYVGERYKNRRHLVWGIGGDAMPKDDLELQVILAMVDGIKSSGAPQLMTYHPGGTKSSSETFHSAAWLDFNMCQSAHRVDNRVWDLIEADWKRTPVKPVIDGECVYEDIPVPLWRHTAETPHATAYEVRRASYAGVFSGGFGCTYGANSVFQYYEPGGSRSFYPTATWRQGLEFPGAAQVVLLRRLMQSRPAAGRIPDQGLVVPNDYQPRDRITATRAEDGRYAMVYSAGGRPFSIHVDRLSGTVLVASWFNPRTGETTRIGEFPRTGPLKFTPPASDSAQDWVLVVDDRDCHFPAPGHVQESLRPDDASSSHDIQHP